MLDTSYAVETPEGVHITLNPAGPLPRGLAWLIDFAVRAIAWFLFGIGSAFLGRLGIGIFLIFAFALEWLYPIIFEIWNNGQTPGKKIMGIVVTGELGTPIGAGQSTLRNLLRFVDMFPIGFIAFDPGFSLPVIFYLVGFISIVLSPKLQRLGDIIAGTVVVYKQESFQHSAIPAAQPSAPPVQLTFEEQHAVIEFAARTEKLSEARTEELADHLKDLTGEAGKEGRNRLLSYAAWLSGKSS